MKKNGSAALMMGLVVGACSAQLASLYGMRETHLVALIWLNGIVALVNSLVNVLERLFVALRLQGRWLMLSIVSCVGQGLVTWFFIERSILAVPLGAILAGLLLLVIGASLVFGTACRQISAGSAAYDT
jgi:hypothetical protein